MAGQWTPTWTGYANLFPRHEGQFTEKNLLPQRHEICDGSMGAFNALAPAGPLVKTKEQWEDLWTGTTFAVAAIHARRRVEGQKL